MKDLKFTACQLMYTFMRKQVFEGLVTYSKVKMINRGYYVTHYVYYKTYVRDQEYSNMIIVLRWNIPTTVVYELYGRSRITTGLLKYFWTKSSRRRYSNIL